MTMFFFFFSSRRRHTRCRRDWSSDVCSSDLPPALKIQPDILFNAGGRRKLGPIPPGTAERAAFGHVLIGEKLFVRMTYPGKGIEIGSVVGIGKIGRASCRERVWMWVGVGA